MDDEPRLAWDLKADLGEGPIWDERDQALWFTDIKRQQVHRYDPAAGDCRSWDCPEQVGFIVPARSGGFIAGLQSGLHRFDPGGGDFQLMVEVEPDRPTNRLNDAVVDPVGRLWFGTMDNGERAKTGAFYCFHRGELRETPISGIAITNGPTVSPDGRILYWVDTLGGRLFACEIRRDAALGESRPLILFDLAKGHPDGPSIDSEGCIWIGIYGGWQARRYSPAGELLDTVQFPVANITKVAFGGADFRTGFATTARHHLDAPAMAKQPHAGGLFEFPVQTPGLPSPLVDD